MMLEVFAGETIWILSFDHILLVMIWFLLAHLHFASKINISQSSFLLYQ